MRGGEGRDPASARARRRPGVAPRLAPRAATGPGARPSALAPPTGRNLPIPPGRRAHLVAPAGRAHGPRRPVAPRLGRGLHAAVQAAPPPADALVLVAEAADVTPGGAEPRVRRVATGRAAPARRSRPSVAPVPVAALAREPEAPVERASRAARRRLRRVGGGARGAGRGAGPVTGPWEPRARPVCSPRPGPSWVPYPAGSRYGPGATTPSPAVRPLSVPRRGGGGVVRSPRVSTPLSQPRPAAPGTLSLP